MQKILFPFLILLLFSLASSSVNASEHKNVSWRWHTYTIGQIILASTQPLLPQKQTLGAHTAANLTVSLAPLPQQISGSPIINEINRYRASKGLAPVQMSAETCAFARTRAQEVVDPHFDHNGFNQRVSNKTIPYKVWSTVTENIAMTSNPAELVTLWINSPPHAENMRRDTPYVCVQKFGNYYAYEGMRP
jgi:uncharacterized protein YkwD